MLGVGSVDTGKLRIKSNMPAIYNRDKVRRSGGCSEDNGAVTGEAV